MFPKLIHLHNKLLKRALIDLFIYKPGDFGGRFYYWFIFIDGDMSKEWITALETHELWHYKQANSIGVLKYYWNYIFDKKFRYDIEMNAYIVEQMVIRRLNLPIERGWWDMDKLGEFVRKQYKC